MSYPLPNETVVKTLRNVEFGTGRPRDEPAPPEVAEYFRGLQSAWLEVGAARQGWLADRCQVTHLAYHQMSWRYECLDNQLRKVLRKHRDHVYTCDGHRFWLAVELHGCRRETVRIEEI